MLSQSGNIVHKSAPRATGMKPGPSPKTRHTLAGVFAVIGAPMRVEQNAEIYGEGEPAEYFYEVVTGAVRTSKLLEDGRRQIDAFHLPGEIFGIEAGPEHGFTAEAVCDSSLRVAKRSTVMAMTGRDAELAADLWACTARQLRAAQEHLILLGRKNAEEKVASFLLGMAPEDLAGDRIELPMSRQDIADYLGLTIETVSRMLTQLRSRATIDLATSRSITLRNLAALQRLNA